MAKTRNKKLTLRFQAVKRDIFEAVRNGRKEVETRAASPKFINIKEDDIIKCVCGKDFFEKKVKKAQIFKNIPEMLKKYKVKQIHPFVNSKKELEAVIMSFPNYREKIKKYGLIAMEFYKNN